MDLLSQRVDSEKRLFVLRKLPVCRELVMMYFSPSSDELGLLARKITLKQITFKIENGYCVLILSMKMGGLWSSTNIRMIIPKNMLSVGI